MKRITAVAVAGLTLLAGAVWLVAGNPVSQSKWDRVHKGMTKAQVLEIMGKPASAEGNQLKYSRFLNAGWVEFAFDERDVVVSKHDESAFGSLK
jgi:hypothetical protein